MARTPLFSPADYFDRSDGLAIEQALLPIVAFWLAFLATDALLWVLTEFTTTSWTRWLYGTVEATLLTLFALTIVVYALGRFTGVGTVTDAIVLAAWGLVPAILGRIAFLFGTYGSANATIALVAAGVLGLVACLWAGYCWHSGFRYTFELQPPIAKLTAVLAVALCTLLVFVPFFL